MPIGELLKCIPLESSNQLGVQYRFRLLAKPEFCILIKCSSVTQYCTTYYWHELNSHNLLSSSPENLLQEPHFIAETVIFCELESNSAGGVYYAYTIAPKCPV